MNISYLQHSPSLSLMVGQQMDEDDESNSLDFAHTVVAMSRKGYLVIPVNYGSIINVNVWTPLMGMAMVVFISAFCAVVMKI